MNSYLSRSARQPLSDLDVLSNVEQALWREELYRVAGRNSIGFEVREGHVTLRGHVVSPMLRSQMAEWAQAAPGVKSVSNELVADADLTIEVAQALGDDPATRPYLIHVGAHAGWVHLGGEVPTTEAQAAAEAVAASVPRVRGVLTLPRVVGAKPPRARRPHQPLAGQAVYASDGSAGRVARVVINPLNRLVSHIVIDSHIELNDRLIRRPIVVPAEALLRVTDGGVFVSDALAELVLRPSFEPESFQRPGWQWQPPYPSSWSQVLWPAQPMYYRLPQKAETRVEQLSGA
jgi:osmotically-inducible protein OsmY